MLNLEGIWKNPLCNSPGKCYNRPFPSSLVPLFQSESKCETILMKMTLICMKMKLHAELIFIRKVSHLHSFWNRGTTELGNGLLTDYVRKSLHWTCRVNKFLLVMLVTAVALHWLVFLIRTFFIRIPRLRLTKSNECIVGNWKIENCFLITWYT